MARANPGTKAVVLAQQMYPQYLQAAKSYFGPVPYGQEAVDRRTADKRLVRMAPEDLAQLAATDPVAALGAQRRLQTLQDRANAEPTLPARDGYEP